MRTGGSFVPFLTSPISAVFLIIAVAVLLVYATNPLRQKKKALYTWWECWRYWDLWYLFCSMT